MASKGRSGRPGAANGGFWGLRERKPVLGEGMKRQKKPSDITIPAGSPFEDVERVIAGDPNVWNKYQKDKLTLADYVYGMASDIRASQRQLNTITLDKISLKHPEFRGTGAVSYFNDLKSNMRRAEKIILEDDFVRQVVQICTVGTPKPGDVELVLRGVFFPKKGHVDLKQIKNALTLARNPFHRTWLEWDARVMLNERKKTGTLSEISNDAPIRMGALCCSSADDGSEYYVEEFIQEPGEPIAFPVLFKYGINTEEAIQIPKLRRIPDGTRFSLNNLEAKTTILLGYIGGALDWEPLDHLALDLNELTYSMMFSAYDRDPKYQFDLSFSNDIKENAGALKFLITALALINSAKIQYNVMSIPSGRRMTGGKSIPYMNHRTVKIIVPAGKRDVTKYLNSVLKIESARKRAHKVRGFWRTLNQGTSSERKVWVKQHVRGDASLGWVNQDHIVTT